MEAIVYLVYGMSERCRSQSRKRKRPTMRHVIGVEISEENISIVKSALKCFA